MERTLLWIYGNGASSKLLLWVTQGVLAKVSSSKITKILIVSGPGYWGTSWETAKGRGPAIGELLKASLWTPGDCNQQDSLGDRKEAWELYPTGKPSVCMSVWVVFPQWVQGSWCTQKIGNGSPFIFQIAFYPSKSISYQATNPQTNKGDLWRRLAATLPTWYAV